MTENTLPASAPVVSAPAAHEAAREEAKFIDLNVDPGEKPADETPKTEEKPVEEAKTSEESEKTVEEGDEEGEAPKKRSVPGSQRLKARNAVLQERITALEMQLQELSAPSKPDAKPGIDRAPKEEDFPGDYLSYDRALNEWNTRKAVREELSTVRKEAQVSIEREAREAQEEALNEQYQVARERIPDFDKVVQAADKIVVKPELRDEILASDKAALLNYYLAQNPDKVDALNELSGKALARAVGQLEASVHLPRAKQATQAPKPLEVPSGGAAPRVNLHDPNLDMDKYVELRQAQIEADFKRRYPHLKQR